MEKEKKRAEKPKYNMAQNVWFMIKTAWQCKEKKNVFLGLAFVASTVGLNVVNLYASPAVVGALERHASVAELVMTILLVSALIMVLTSACQYIEGNLIFGRITQRLALIGRINYKAATTSYPNLENEEFKKLQTKASESCSSNVSATEAIWETLTAILINVFGLIIYAALMATAQPVLIVVILVTSVVSYLISNRLNEYEYRHRDEETEITRHINYLDGRARNVEAAKDIRIFGLRPWLESLYDKALDAYTAFHRKAESVYIWAEIVDLVLTFARNAIAYVYLLKLVLYDGMSVAEFLLLFGAVGGFAQWVTGVLGGFNKLHRQSLDISSIREYLEYEEPFLFEKGRHITAEPDKMYEIRMENVTFRYPGADKDALTNINLTLHPGEKLAVVGLNGAGKTTLVKLLCGFLDPTEGRVLLDGTDIRVYNRADYYTLFSAVFQDLSLLAATIAVNVAQTLDSVDTERVKECIDKAGLRKKIESLPDQYETFLNHEVYDDAILLSGGETQRLILARALYKDAPFILLDEPTAALDPIAEADLYSKYNEMTQGRSSVYISHRLASTRFCDRIIMIGNSSIIEEGTHEELLARCGEYAKLYEVQSKYYKEGADEDGEE